MLEAALLDVDGTLFNIGNLGFVNYVTPEENAEPTPSPTPTPTPASSDSNPMYRLDNPNSGEHFYTADNSEANHLVSVGWRAEGIGWYGIK